MLAALQGIPSILNVLEFNVMCIYIVWSMCLCDLTDEHLGGRKIKMSWNNLNGKWYILNTS